MGPALFYPAAAKETEATDFNVETAGTIFKFRLRYSQHCIFGSVRPAGG